MGILIAVGVLVFGASLSLLLIGALRLLRWTEWSPERDV